ncbi:MAG: pantetheine-phosphate adenylyltransferase [Halanaerobiaceae bacterium]
MSEVKVVYPGSFDPVTNGHLSIIKRASAIFDKIIVAVFQNPSKDPLFSMSKRVELLCESTASMEKVEIDSFSGLTMDYVKSREATAILRGLRAVSDFEGEFQMASMNRELNDDVETVFLMTDSRYAFLSSSVLKEVAQFGGDISALVPNCVDKALRSRYGLSSGD